MVCNSHGYWRNGYMGSAVMWPLHDERQNDGCFSLVSLEYLVPGDRIKQIVADPTPPPSSFSSIGNWLGGMYRWISGAPKGQLTLGQCYQEAVKRSNVLLHVELTDDKGDSVHIWAYHMPCAFQNPGIMRYHADEVVRTIHEAAKSDMHLLCMDGNFQPYTELYYTFVEAGFNSTALVATRAEPKWTCSSNSIWGGTFAGTLDYVWHLDTSDCCNKNYDYQVTFADVVEDDDGRPPFLPSIDFPSDHLWMDVTITEEIVEKESLF